MQNFSTINNQHVSDQSPIDWLKNKDLNFKTSNSEELVAIMNFTLVWSYFEATKLKRSASARTIQIWADSVDFSFSKFETNFDYFRGRYFVNDEFTDYFSGLRLRQNDNEYLVKNIIQTNTKNSRDSIVVLLIIVYRLRNNLFHGIKWGDGIKDQAENFKHATQALMAACETHTLKLK